jgi:hypothetical protein
MLIQSRHAIASDLKGGEEVHCPTIPRTENDVVDVRDAGAIFEVYRPFFNGDMGDRGVSLDVRIAERVIAEVRVVFAANDAVERG